MKILKKRKMSKVIKLAVAFVCLLGVTTYALSDGVSTASESKGKSLLSDSTQIDTSISAENRQYLEEAAHFEGKVPFKITFDSNQFLGPMESYSWNFGDGEMAQGAVASHTFLSAGTYSVTLIAKQKSGQIHQEQISVLVEPKQ